MSRLTKEYLDDHAAYFESMAAVHHEPAVDSQSQVCEFRVCSTASIETSVDSGTFNTKNVTVTEASQIWNVCTPAETTRASKHPESCPFLNLALLNVCNCALLGPDLTQ